jgi:hypothetical protein
MPRPLSHTVDVDFGYNGYGKTYSIPKEIHEEELNAFASNELGYRVATPDYTGPSYQTQQFRFYPDISQGSPIWITLKQTQTRVKLILIMRPSPKSAKEAIEAKVSEVWGQTTVCRSKFPDSLDPNETYWMKPKESIPGEEQHWSNLNPLALHQFRTSKHPQSKQLRSSDLFPQMTAPSRQPFQPRSMQISSRVGQSCLDLNVSVSGRLKPLPSKLFVRRQLWR